MAQQIKVSSADPTINLVLDTLKIGKQCIVFANTKKSAEKAAEDIAKSVKSAAPEFEEFSDKALHALSRPTQQCERLAQCLKKGVAFHHAGLTYEQRDLIEEGFRSGRLPVICATPTLAYGLDLPAYRVILKDLRRYTQRGLQFIPVLEYLQMAGRAGRPSYGEKEGQAIAVCTSDEHKQKIIDKYINGFPEAIQSKLAVEPVLRTYVLSLIAAEYVRNYDDIIAFFERTFWAYQFGDTQQLQYIIDKMLDLLVGWEFLVASNATARRSEFMSADSVGEVMYTATPIGKRVAELYVDPLTAHEFIEMLGKTARIPPTTFSYVHVVSSSLEMRPWTRVKVKEMEDIQFKLASYHEDLLRPEPAMYDPEYDDFLNGFKTALLLYDWADEKDEEFLLESYDVRPGELRGKLDVADWLVYTLEELARLLRMQTLIPGIRKTRLRLQYGVKDELFTLLKLKDIGRVRARRLFNNNFKDIGDVKRAEFSTLAQLIGQGAARSVKSQVGEPVPEPVKESKRKGQMSLGKY